MTLVDQAIADLEALAAGSLPMDEMVGRGLYPRYTARVEGLWAALREAGLDPDAVLDYVGWRAGRAADTPDTIAAMSAADLRHLAVAMRRSERFSDGAWASMLQSGVFLAVLRRAKALGPTP